jgi:hypothetical protein
MGVIGTAPSSRGIEEPREIAETIKLADRAFAFVDLCGFTHFIAENGEHAAIDTLSQFRSLARDISARRGGWRHDRGRGCGPDRGHRRRTDRAL